MKNQLNVISRYALCAAAAGALCLNSQAFAQKAEATPERPTGTGSMAGVGQKPSKTDQTATTQSPSPNTQGGSVQIAAQDRNFLMEAGKGGMMEVEMGKMAEQQGQSDQVKKLGKQMVADHSKANNQLMSIAGKKGVKVDANTKMEKLDKSNFDQAWLSQMVRDHEKTIAAFENEAKGGSDQDVKSFASKTLPTLKKHLEMLNAAQGRMGKGSPKKAG